MSAVDVPPAFLVVGECVADVVTSVAGAVDVHPGGSPANVAFGLCRLGSAVTLITALGHDPYGSLIRAHLESAGVRVVNQGLDKSTATALAQLDENGAASYTFRFDWELNRSAPAPVTPLHVHTGSIGAAMEPGAAAVSEMVESLHRLATVSLDPNIRPALLTDRAAVRQRLESLLKRSDVVKASDEDLQWLYPDLDPLESAREWLTRGPSVVVMTRGAAGSVALCRAGVIEVSPTPVAVVDTVGAGDSFMAALLDGLHGHRMLGLANRPKLANISLDSLRLIVARASRAAAITVSRAGAMPPTRHQLDEGVHSTRGKQTASRRATNRSEGGPAKG